MLKIRPGDSGLYIPCMSVYLTVHLHQIVSSYLTTVGALREILTSTIFMTLHNNTQCFQDNDMNQ